MNSDNNYYITFSIFKLLIFNLYTFIAIKIYNNIYLLFNKLNLFIISHLFYIIILKKYSAINLI